MPRSCTLTHGITPQHVLQGALVLCSALAYMPVAAIFLAVVDPGVGTSRRAVAVDCADGRAFVGPDNGLLAPAIEAAGGAVRVHEITNPDLILTPTSATFHGRDIFAPTAAFLAGGGDISDVGPALEPDSLFAIAIPEATRLGDCVIAQVWDVDSFGNVSLHLDEKTLTELLDGNDRCRAHRAR